MRRWFLGVLILLLAMPAWGQSVPEKAGSQHVPSTYFQFTCIPELDYFKFEPIHSWLWLNQNLSHFKTEAEMDEYLETKERILWEKYHIFSESKGEKYNIYQCNLKKPLKIKFLKYVNASGIDGGFLEVYINDQMLIDINIIDRNSMTKYLVYQEGRIMHRMDRYYDTDYPSSTFTLLYYDIPECVRILKKLIHTPLYMSDPYEGTDKPFYEEKPCYAYQRTKLIEDPRVNSPY